MSLKFTQLTGNTTYDLTATPSMSNGNVEIQLESTGYNAGEIDRVKITGSGATTVSTDANGNISISSPVLTDIATNASVDTKIANLVNSAPEALNTLGELATALETHEDAYDALLATVGGKVDKVSGKGLSTNDLTATLKSNYDTAYNHSQATHARTDATKVEASSTNGNIKINGAETTVYTHPTGTNPHGTTKSDVGLGNVGNFKAVSTVASQGLTDTEKSNARANIGAGTSSLTLAGNGSATTAAKSDHTHSSYVNQNAFSNIKVAKSGGGTTDVTVAADTTTDTVTFEGSNVTITGDATNDKVTIGITKTNVTNALGYTPPTTDSNTTYTFATGDANGQIKVTPSGGSAQNVAVKGLGSAAYTNSNAYMAAGDTSHGTHVSYGGNGSATTVSRSDHTHSDYVSKTTNTLLNDAISTTWTKFGGRKVIITGNDITFDLSAAEGGWACNFASVIDPADVRTTMLGVYGGDTGLTHVYMGGTHSDPALKMTPAGQFTFKNTPKVGSVDVALTSDLPTFTYNSTTKTLTIS